jgi:hypothetical protein
MGRGLKKEVLEVMVIVNPKLGHVPSVEEKMFF